MRCRDYHIIQDLEGLEGATFLMSFNETEAKQQMLPRYEAVCGVTAHFGDFKP